jgi:hypothetical protein
MRTVYFVAVAIAGLLSLSAQAWCQGAQYGRSESNAAVYLPDDRVSPGAIRTTDAGEICAKTFRTAKYRKTTASTKKKVYAEYGVTPNKGICKGGCEVDHRVPLELGGEDVIENLWPQPSEPAPGFHQKDILENWLKHSVCIDKTMTLKQAQKALLGDWFAAYEQMPAGKR